MMGSDPERIYSARLEERTAALAAHEARHRRLGNLRLAAGAAAAVIAWLAFARGALSAWWLLAPAVAFAALAAVHERVLAARERSRRAVAFYERSLDTLAGKFHGETGLRYLDPHHPYAQDLDLFGEGSLFQLLTAARTHTGEETLARWLLAPAAPETIAARHAAVAELTPRLDLREDLAVLEEEVRTGVDPSSLAAWGEAAPLLRFAAARAVLGALGLAGGAAVAGIVLRWLAQLGAFAMSAPLSAVLRDFFLVMLVVNATVTWRLRRGVAEVVHGVEHAAHGLGLLSGVLFRIERERFASPLLAGLRASLDIEGHPPSERIRRLNRILDYLDSRHHVLVRAVDPLILFTPRLAVAAERWRRTSGPAVRRWLHAAGEIEALSSIAGYAFDHPGDPFPEIVPGDARLEAEALAHPMIPLDRAVRNDVALGSAARLLIVSGSNMSGKSTLLRAAGINTVLALAGAPVRAARLRLSPLQVGASIRVVDSLQTGTSRFYAEVLRLRQIVDLTRGDAPVLFLLDEFLHGTNSHDRSIGAGALARGLVERGAIGFLTTHDLALAGIADALGGRAANVHFEDHLEDGKMSFDYRLRPGVVRKSNALELMRSVGLEV